MLSSDNAFGGKVRGARVAVVDYDHGEQSVKVREAFDSVAANIRTFTTVPYSDERAAREDVRTGKLDGAVIIPEQYSRRVLAGDSPKLGLVVDNSDQFMSSSIEAEMQSLVDALSRPVIDSNIVKKISLEIVELYPYVEYMKYLLPGSVSLAMYVSVMIGGGMLYIDDKARGVHEGYLVTPITKLELVLGLNVAGAIKAVLAGACTHHNRFAPRRIGHHLPSSAGDLQLLAPDRCHFHRIQRDDVPPDGARRRSPGPACPFRRIEHSAVLSQRSNLSHLRISEMAAGDHHH